MLLFEVILTIYLVFAGKFNIVREKDNIEVITQKTIV